MKKQKRGYILISVLVIMMVMLVITYFLADALFAEVSIARNQKAATLSFNAAEAGIANAVWQLQNDTATKNTFLTTTNGQTVIPSKTLQTNNSYSVVIQNTALAAATITSTGLYNMGTKDAQRVISLKVIQPVATGPYNYDASLLVGGPSSGNMYLHNLNLTYDTGYDPSSIACGGNIDIGNANINVSKDILSNQTITEHNSNVTHGGTEQSNYPTAFVMPGVDVNSSAPTSYKSMAITQNQYYTSDQFATLIKTQTTFNGIVYVAGSGGITIKNKNITVNGMLVSEGSVTVTNANLTINHTTGPSGLITLSSFNITNANIDISGLLYVGVLNSMSVNTNIKVTGAIIAHDFSANNINLTLNFKKDWVNEGLLGGNSPETPVIQYGHWEEEY
jgi:type II secretory pathway pseudopilin PulG